MCYYNGIKVSREEFIRLKDLEISVSKLMNLMVPVSSAFDFAPNIVVVQTPGHTLEAVAMEWGFLPSYIRNREEARKMRTGYMGNDGKWVTAYDMQNAKGEEMLEKTRTYQQAAKQRRCLVLSSWFFEWRHIFGTNKRTGEPKKTPDKYPYLISLKDKDYFFFAGIWQPWTDLETGETVNTYSVVTTAANPLMEIIHNTKKRMPVILPDDLALEWVSEGLSDQRIREIASYQYSWKDMTAHLVDKDFRKSIDPTTVVVNNEITDPVEEAVKLFA